MGLFEFREELGEFRGLGGGDEEIKIVQGFFRATIGTGDGGAGNLGVILEAFEESFGDGGDVAQAETVREFLAVLDGGEDFFDRFGAEARELGDFRTTAGILEGGDGIDAELVVESFDFFGAEALDLKKFEEGGRKLGAKVFEIFQSAGGGEFVEFLLKRVANPFDALEVIGGGEGHNVPIEVLNDLGTVAVGAGLEGILALEFE